jgi:glycerate 2-kinase
MRETLQAIWITALDRCAPQRLVQSVDVAALSRDVVAIGKCAGALLDGLAAAMDVRSAFCVIPEGYRAPESRCELHAGGHPGMTGASFAAGRALLDFVAAREDVTFLISGGGSACVEEPLRPWFDERDVAETNARLVASGIPISDINCVRRHLSAIKGGRLAAGLRRSATLVFSDVSPGALADVASGPTLPDDTTKSDAIGILERVGGCDRIVARLRDSECPETVRTIEHARVELIADNATLTAAAAEAARAEGLTPVTWEGQIEMDVSDAARRLMKRASELGPGEVLIAGGEPTVARRGGGQGGRCSELAARAALIETGITVEALFGASDGVDGSTGVAGFFVSLPAGLDRGEAERELERSNSFAVASRIGEPLTIRLGGNNLRDLYLLARK